MYNTASTAALLLITIGAGTHEVRELLRTPAAVVVADVFVFALSVQLLKYFQAEMALRFRQRLTEHVMDKYMKGFNFYAVSNLDDRLSNADQV